MNLETWLKEAAAKLTSVGIGSARLDCLILLEDLLARDRTYLLAHPEIELTRQQLNTLSRQLRQRAHHTPLAYIRGFSEFYGRRFLVNKKVLEPRIESEVIIKLLKILKLPPKPKVADIGTGSGAIGITAKLEIPEAEVDLYDIDSNCLAVARHNAHLHELSLHIYKRDLLSRPARVYDVILANLPYVPDAWHINEAAAMEPRIAIFGGPDGLDHYRRMFAQLARQQHPAQFVLTECLPPQHEALTKIAATNNYKQKASQDFIQVFTT